MADMGSIKGLQVVLKNLKARREVLGKGLERGLKKAGLRLQAASQKLVPVNTGNLKASAFTRSRGSGMSTVVSVGYTARYALWVHESVGMVLKGQPRPKGKGFYWDPQGQAQAKFLEEPMRRMAKELREIIKKEAKIA